MAVDVTPDALLNRLKRGAIYKPEIIEKALSGFFKASNLGALREMTLRQAAHEVDLRQTAYDETSDARLSTAVPDEASRDAAKERILIVVTADPSTAMLIRRGHADCIALFVHRTPQITDLPADERRKLEKHLRFARSLQMETRVVAGIDIAKTVVEFARSHHVTQVLVAPSREGLKERLLGRNFVENIVRLAEDLQVTIVADRSRRSGSS